MRALIVIAVVFVLCTVSEVQAARKAILIAGHYTKPDGSDLAGAELKKKLEDEYKSAFPSLCEFYSHLKTLGYADTDVKVVTSLPTGANNGFDDVQWSSLNHCKDISNTAGPFKPENIIKGAKKAEMKAAIEDFGGASDDKFIYMVGHGKGAVPGTPDKKYVGAMIMGKTTNKADQVNAVRDEYWFTTEDWTTIDTGKFKSMFVYGDICNGLGLQLADGGSTPDEHQKWSQSMITSLTSRKQALIVASIMNWGTQVHNSPNIGIFFNTWKELHGLGDIGHFNTAFNANLRKANPVRAVVESQSASATRHLPGNNPKHIVQHTSQGKLETITVPARDETLHPEWGAPLNELAAVFKTTAAGKLTMMLSTFFPRQTLTASLPTNK